MKARNKETGEEYEVIDFTVKVDNDSDFTVILPNDESFEIVLDRPIIATLDTTEPDWEQRRYELAKAAMHGMLANPAFSGLRTKPEDVAIMAVGMKNAMIAELKKPKK